MSGVSDEMVAAAAIALSDRGLHCSWGNQCNGPDLCDECQEMPAEYARAVLEAVEPLIRPALYRRYRAQRDLARAENKRLRDGITVLMQANKAKIPNGSWSYTGIGNTALEALLSEAGDA